MTWARWALVVVVGLSACRGDDRLPQLRTVGADLLRAAMVEPPPGEGPVAPTEVRDKALDYVVADGVVLRPPPEASTAVIDALRRTGFTVVRSGTEGAVGARDDLVAEFTLATRLGVRQAVDGTTLVQLRLAVRDSRLGWTQV